MSGALDYETRNKFFQLFKLNVSQSDCSGVHDFVRCNLFHMIRISQAARLEHVPFMAHHSSFGICDTLYLGVLDFGVFDSLFYKCEGQRIEFVSGIECPPLSHGDTAALSVNFLLKCCKCCIWSTTVTTFWRQQTKGVLWKNCENGNFYAIWKREIRASDWLRPRDLMKPCAKVLHKGLRRILNV